MHDVTSEPRHVAGCPTRPVASVAWCIGCKQPLRDAAAQTRLAVRIKCGPLRMLPITCVSRRSWPIDGSNVASNGILIRRGKVFAHAILRCVVADRLRWWSTGWRRVLRLRRRARLKWRHCRCILLMTAVFRVSAVRSTRSIALALLRLCLSLQ